MKPWSDSPAGLWLPLACVLLPLAGFLQWAQSISLPGSELDRGERTVTLTSEWPDPNAEWRPLQLASRGCDSAAPCYDHFRLGFQHDPPRDGDYGLFVPKIAGSLRVNLNGQTLGTIGSIEPPIATLHFHPTFFDLPSHMLRAGANELQITLTSSSGNFQALWPLQVGPREALRRAAAPIIWLQMDANTLAIGIYSIAFAFALLMLLLVDRSPLYGWFALVAAMALLRNLYFVVTDPRLDELKVVFYFFGSHLQLAALAGLTAHLVHAARSSPARDRLFVGFTVLMALATVGILVVLSRWPELGPDWSVRFTNLLFVVVSVYVLYGMIRFYRARPDALSAWVLAFVLGSYLITALEAWAILVQNKSVDVQLSPLSPILLVFGYWLVVVGGQQRSLQALRHADRDKLAALEVQRITIKRDLHDGVAAQIASLVMLARRRSPELAPYLEESLSDLRGVMDTLDTASGHVVEIVGDLRPKIASLLTEHELEHDWRVDIGARSRLDATGRRTLYFALLEAMHNTLRHAQARRLRFGLSEEDEELIVEVADDGVGIPDVDAVLERGRGLHGLRQRLAAIGGGLEVRSVGGTQLRFQIPLEVST
ncbi:MAG: ATP-binding protein [Pseudomonadota bacterium]